MTELSSLAVKDKGMMTAIARTTAVRVTMRTERARATEELEFTENHNAVTGCGDFICVSPALCLWDEQQTLEVCRLPD